MRMRNMRQRRRRRRLQFNVSWCCCLHAPRSVLLLTYEAGTPVLCLAHIFGPRSKNVALHICSVPERELWWPQRRLAAVPWHEWWVRNGFCGLGPVVFLCLMMSTSDEMPCKWYLFLIAKSTHIQKPGTAISWRFWRAVLLGSMV